MSWWNFRNKEKREADPAPVVKPITYEDVYGL